MNGPLIFSMWMRPVLHRLDGVGQLQQLACGGFGIGEGARLDEFHLQSYARRRLHAQHPT
jgi:hypothetical protein